MKAAAQHPGDQILKGYAGLCGLVATVNIIIHVILWKDWQEAFWYCNFATLVAAFGVLRHKQALISGVLISAIPAQGLWIIDYILQAFDRGMGRTAWLFDSTEGFDFTLSTVLHGILIPLCIYSCLQRGYSKRGYIYTFVIFILGLHIATYLGTTPEKNINCVFYPCDWTWEKDALRITASNTYNKWEYVGGIILQWILMIPFVHGCLYFAFNRWSKVIP